MAARRRLASAQVAEVDRRAETAGHLGQGPGRRRSPASAPRRSARGPPARSRRAVTLGAGPAPGRDRQVRRVPQDRRPRLLRAGPAFAGVTRARSATRRRRPRSRWSATRTPASGCRRSRRSPRRTTGVEGHDLPRLAVRLRDARRRLATPSASSAASPGPPTSASVLAGHYDLVVTRPSDGARRGPVDSRRAGRSARRATALGRAGLGRRASASSASTTRPPEHDAEVARLPGRPHRRLLACAGPARVAAARTAGRGDREAGVPVAIGGPRTTTSAGRSCAPPSPVA